MPEPMTEQELSEIAEWCSSNMDLPLGIFAMVAHLVVEVRRLRKENEALHRDVAGHKEVGTELFILGAELLSLRELHADALRQIKLIQEKADVENAALLVVAQQLREKNEVLQRRDDHVTGCLV